MTVEELIRVLRDYPLDMEVAYHCYSELCVLHKDSIIVEEHCLPRDEGWVQRARPDMKTQKYLTFPGN